MSAEPTLQDEAARAGWLYYVAGMTQDQIALELGVSRQRAQRLVSRAMAEGLIATRAAALKTPAQAGVFICAGACAIVSRAMPASRRPSLR